MCDFTCDEPNRKYNGDSQGLLGGSSKWRVVFNFFNYF